MLLVVPLPVTNEGGRDDPVFRLLIKPVESIERRSAEKFAGVGFAHLSGSRLLGGNSNPATAY